MEPGCFTARQRVSIHAMNADVLKAAPAASVKSSRSKGEPTKPELAQVVTDSRTGRSYSKGKLLGKVRQNPDPPEAPRTDALGVGGERGGLVPETRRGRNRRILSYTRHNRSNNSEASVFVTFIGDCVDDVGCDE